MITCRTCTHNDRCNQQAVYSHIMTPTGAAYEHYAAACRNYRTCSPEERLQSMIMQLDKAMEATP